MGKNDQQMAAALKNWLRVALQTIEKNFDELIQLIDLPRWYRQECGGFRQYRHSAMYRHSVLEKAIFDDCPSWSEVVLAADNNDVVSRHIGFLRSESGNGRAYSLKDHCMSLLPPLELIGENSIYANTDYDPAIKVDEFMSAMTVPYVENVVVWPIYGLATKNSVHLDEVTEFRELNDEEKAWCLNFEIIKPHYTTEVPADQTRWFGLCRTVRDEKLFGEESMHDFTRISHRYGELEQVLEDFLASVPFANDRIAHHAGGYAGAPHFELGTSFSFGTIGRGVGSSNHTRFMFVDESFILDEQVAKKLTNAWKFMRSSGSAKFHKRVTNAARRLFFAETRPKQQDALVDLMIAAESLYLNEEKSELKFRMSVNAALWAYSERSQQQQAFEIFKNAYDLRSKIVHGSSVSPQSVSETISAVKPLIRDGVRRAMEHLEFKSEAPKWEELLFQSFPKVNADN